MIDFEVAKVSFLEYVSQYNQADGRVQLKLTHTFGVVMQSEMLAQQLKLKEEDVQLAKLIALLHDIGRFEQAKQYQDFTDHQAMDHAEYGVQILFGENKIRAFVKNTNYDETIRLAILNHNRYEIQNDLDDYVKLHAMLIRDADKLDNFRVKVQDDFESIGNFTKEQLEHDVISDHVFTMFLTGKAILAQDRETSLDMWVSYLAFIFDINFHYALITLKEKNYIDAMVDRLSYQREETKQRMEEIREYAYQYLCQRIEQAEKNMI